MIYAEVWIYYRFTANYVGVWKKRSIRFPTQPHNHAASPFRKFNQRVTSRTISFIIFTESPHFVTKHSPSMTIKEKQNVTLPYKATGFPLPVIKWYKDDHVIEEKRTQFKKSHLKIKNICLKIAASTPVQRRICWAEFKHWITLHKISERNYRNLKCT